GPLAGERLDIAEAHVADEATGSRAGGQILGGAPVADVVPCAVAGPGVVGYLVVLEATRGGRAYERPVLRDDGVLFRQVFHPTCAPGTAPIQRERVRRDVIGPPIEHALNAGHPRLDGEAGQAIHEVDADVVVAGLARGVECRARPTRVVQAAEGFEDVVVQRLHAETHASDA